MRSLSSTVLAKSLHNRCDRGRSWRCRTMASALQNVFNNKADFKVLLPAICAKGPQRSGNGLGAILTSPARETLKDGDEMVRPRPPANASQPAMPWLKRYPGDVDWRMPLKVAPLYTLLDEAVAETPRSHLHELSRQDADLRRDRPPQVERAPPACSGSACGRAPRSGCSCPTRPTFIVYFFAVLKAGGTVVNYNPLYTVSELAVPGQGQRHRADGDARPARCCSTRSRRCCSRRAA